MATASSLPSDAPPLSRPVVIAAARERLGAKLAELWRYRELFYFLVWRDVKVRYAQSVLGIGWAVIQPIVPMVIFTIVFGRVARISSDGIPYALFSYAALVPWTYFSNALSESGGSLVKDVNMLSKIYFPRMILPLTSVLGRLIDFVVSFLLLFVLMAWYQANPTPWVAALPLLMLVMIATVSGLGMWLSALTLQYRDVRHAMTFVVQLLMYAAPVVYPTSLIPGAFRYLYALNPMVGVIEGFRASLLGATPMPWDLVAIGSVSALVIFSTGMRYFVRREAAFADVG
jgi:lipopolysaccharide transport system permease protein